MNLCKGGSLGSGSLQPLAQTLVHESLHNCVGPQEHTDLNCLPYGREGVTNLTKEFMASLGLQLGAALNGK